MLDDPHLSRRALILALAGLMLGAGTQGARAGDDDDDDDDNSGHGGGGDRDRDDDRDDDRDRDDDDDRSGSGGGSDDDDDRSGSGGGGSDDGGGSGGGGNRRISDITVRYSDGWVERIIGGRYELIDDLSRQVIARTATYEDYARMIALR